MAEFGGEFQKGKNCGKMAEGHLSTLKPSEIILMQTETA